MYCQINAPGSSSETVVNTAVVNADTIKLFKRGCFMVRLMKFYTAYTWILGLCMRLGE